MGRLSRIAFIAPDRALYRKAQTAIAELGLKDRVALYFSRLTQAVKLAQRLESQDIDVIITRGGTAKLMADAKIKIPVVEVEITGQDLAQVLYEAKTITGLASPKIAMIAFSNMARDIESLSTILDVQLTTYPVNTVEDIPLRIQQAARSGHDIVVGGKRTVSLALKRGLKALLIRSGDFSVNSSLILAQQIAQGRKLDRERSEEFKAIINHSLEGIISINRDKIVRVFNEASARLLNCPSEKALGQDIGQILDRIDIDSCLATGQPLNNQIFSLGNVWITANVSPITVGQEIIGAIVTLQDITQVQEAEAKIRKEIVSRKFVTHYSFTDIKGTTKLIAEAKQNAMQIALSDSTVLIFGESGTGKELFCQSIHNNSPRKHGPFVAVNCASLPPSLLESELFGYVEGAFTGATKKGKAGLFELAHQGTLFLDEISEMDKYGQSTLLRVLQEKQVMRLGDDRYVPINVRIIAATNKDLDKLVEAGQFREDLFYRLNVLSLYIPPLRQRPDDVKYLAQHFLDHFTAVYKKRLQFTPEAFSALAHYPWPGNVRQLMHFIERLAVIISAGAIDDTAVYKYLNTGSRQTPAACEDGPITAAEKALIIKYLEQYNANINKVAEALGIARSTLYKKLKKYKIAAQKVY